MATIKELETALVNAHNAGDADSARKIAAVLKRAMDDSANLIPGAEVPETIPEKRKATIGETAVGTGEAALSAVTGATIGTLGAVGGALYGAGREIASGEFGSPQAARRIEQQAMAGAEAGTFAPRTPSGQAQAAALGEALSVIPPIVPMAGQLAQVAQVARPSAAAAQTMARAAVPGAVQRVQQVAAPIQRAAQTVTAPVRNLVETVRPTEQAGSLGAAETPAAMVRRERAAQMPVPFEGESAPTVGQATRDFEQLQFEKETAKQGSTGAPLRERAMNQGEVLQQNFDALVDVASPQFLDKQAIGGAVDSALVNRANVAMRKINEAYTKARESGQMDEQISTAPIADALNDAWRFEGVAPAVKAARNEALRVGALAADEDGVITGSRMSINDAETFRQFVNDSTDWTNKQQARISRRIIDGIDASMEGATGQLYKDARKLRRAYAEEFENQSLTRKLLNTKRGTDERQVAIEDIYDRVIVRSSVEEMNKLRGSLLKAGPEGKQAWANLKAKAIDDIKESGLTQARDERGNQIISPAALNKAIQRLDQSGKLEALYGKKQAQTIRDLGDIATDISTAPPGAVNFSNTASALRVAMDSFGTFAFTGIPAPAVTALKEATKYVRDAKTRARIREALRDPATTKTGKF